MPTIDAVYSYRTYGGCYEGAPSPKQLIAKAEQEAKDLWGERAILVIQPSITSRTLPEWTNMVWAHGEPISEVGHGSELILVWWSAYAPAGFDHVLEAVDWNRHAEDYEI